MILPIRLTPVERHIHADRRLAFQVLTAFGVRQEDGSSSMVLKAEGDRKLVEFHSVIPTFRHGQKRGQKMYRTVEWVTLLEPEEIRFEGVEGPVDLLQDRFVLQNLDGCTLFRYESTIGIKGGLAGWLKGQNTIPGYGHASAGIRAVLATAGQSPDAQISALQRSGWASSGYPSLPQLYRQVAG